MDKYRRILLIVDRSMKQTPAFRRAHALARSSGASLLLCLFDHHNAVRAAGLFNQEVGQWAQDAFLREKAAWLEDVALDLREEGLSVTSEVIWGTPLHEQVIAKVTATASDLVIKDVHYEPLLKRVLFTPLDWHLLRLCPSPLLLVNAQSGQQAKRVIAAVDPGHAWHEAGALNERIFQHAKLLAHEFGASVQLVHAFEGLPIIAPAELGGVLAYPNDIYEELRTRASRQFTAFADHHNVPAKSRHLLYGDPANVIADFAEDASTDIVVLGTLYRTGLERLTIGSTAERVLDQLRCDVLAIKPEGFSGA